MKKLMTILLLTMMLCSTQAFSGNRPGYMTSDQKAALDGANAPSADNVLATMNDVAAIETGVQTITPGANMSNSGTEADPVLNVDMNDSSTSDTEPWSAAKIIEELADKLDIADSPVISDVAYDADTWNANTDAASKNAIRDKIESLASDSSTASLTLDYKLYRVSLGESYTGYIDCQLVISQNSDFSAPDVDIDMATSQTDWLAYCAASDSYEAWSASGMPATDVRSIIYKGTSLTRGTVYYYRWRTYAHGDTEIATDYKGGMLCL